jgi:polyisoprenoid-binding protein YceI
VKRSRIVLGIAGLIALAGVAGAAGLAYLFLRGAPPAAVSLDPGSSQPAASLGALATGATSSIGAGGLDGTWSIDTSIGSFSDFSSSWVGYRVDETLAGNRANTAVGRTPDVSGTLVLSDTQIATVEVTANLQTLRSDDNRRDGQLQHQAIETSQFPQATFKLTAPVELVTLPTDGQTITATATGELTLHGVTRTVAVPIEARLSGDVVTIAGSIAIQFADYDIERPTSFVVLSIEDHGVMEFQLHFRHQ